MKLDFPVAGSVTVSSEAELRDALRSHPRVRLAGTATAQRRIPAPVAGAVADAEVTVVSLAGLNRILRLEADDLTCSVEPGVGRQDLDTALHELGLSLPCAGTGTIGGIFAADEFGPTGPARPEPRSLVLGMTAVLAEGKRFRSGARVVKNVAGFDLQKLFVGSRGRLFAVTEIHLKLRPAPRSILHFHSENLPRRDALELTARIRQQPTRPSTLILRGSGSFSVSGTLAGHPRHLEKLETDLDLRRSETPPLDAPAHADGPELEIVQGQIPFRRLEELLARLPDSAFFTLLGERFTVQLPRTATDDLLGWLPGLESCGEITVAEPSRRGLATPADPVAQRLSTELKQALDPRGVLR